MKAWLFSDLHLEDCESNLYQSFIRVLGGVQSTDTVVFAGDIFDLLVGNSNFFRRRYSQFFDQVEHLAKMGVQLHYIEGNHDFHLKRLFSSTMQFHDRELMLFDDQPEGKKGIYVAHGDLVDESDHSYLAMRSLFRSKVVQFLSHQVPGALVDCIGGLISRPQAQKKDQLPEYWDSGRQNKLRATFRNFARRKHDEGFDYIVLGHCHDLDEVAPYYFNMGYPPVHGYFLVYENGKLGRQKFDQF